MDFEGGNRFPVQDEELSTYSSSFLSIDVTDQYLFYTDRVYKK